MTSPTDPCAAPAGATIDVEGRLVRDAGGFVLRCHSGRSLALLLPRTPIDHVEKSVRLRGTLVAPGVLEVAAIRAAG